MSPWRLAPSAFIAGRERTHGVLADHLERDALADIAHRPAVGDQRLLRMGEHVDEAGRHRLAVGVEGPRRRSGRVAADIGDAVALDRDLAAVGRRAGAVIDRRRS